MDFIRCVTKVLCYGTRFLILLRLWILMVLKVMFLSGNLSVNVARAFYVPYSFISFIFHL